MILDLVGEYARRHHAPKPFVPGESPVPVSGKVYGAPDMQSLVDSSLDFWLTTGRFNAAFEERLAEPARRSPRADHQLGLVGQPAGVLGADLALSARRRAEAGRRGHHRRRRLPDHGQPVLQYGLVPVFVDVDIPTYNIKPELIEAAVSDRTRAIMIAHTLGNPFDLDEVMRRRREARPVAGRGLLRRARRDLSRPGRRHVRRHRHAELLSRAPHHHGRRRRGLHRQAAAQADRSNRSATGAATASARRARTTPAASASAGSSATCRWATTTSTPTATSATI